MPADPQPGGFTSQGRTSTLGPSASDRREVFMHFELIEEHRMLQDLVARFVRENLIPLEQNVLERDAAGQGAYLTEDERGRIDQRSHDLGLWGLDAPADVGGTDLPSVAMIGVHIEMGKTCVPYYLPPDSPKLPMPMATVNDEQQKRDLAPEVQARPVSGGGVWNPGGRLPKAHCPDCKVRLWPV